MNEKKDLLTAPLQEIKEKVAIEPPTSKLAALKKEKEQAQSSSTFTKNVKAGVTKSFVSGIDKEEESKIG